MPKRSTATRQVEPSEQPAFDLALLPSIDSEYAFPDLDTASFNLTESATAAEVRSGRPAGATNIQYDIVDGILTQCQKCGSTERTPYIGRPNYLRRSFIGKIVITVLKRTKCAKCGQHRKDRFVTEQPANDANP